MLEGTVDHTFAGQLKNKVAPAPPENSWASDQKNYLSIQVIELEPIVTADTETAIMNVDSTPAKVLILEAEPILESIISHGLFLMTTHEEIEQTFKDYQETEFGGWLFSSSKLYHDVNQECLQKMLMEPLNTQIGRIYNENTSVCG